MSCETCKNHEMDAISEATKESRILSDVTQKYAKQNKCLLIAVLVESFALVAAVVIMAVMAFNFQSVVTEAVSSALEAVAEFEVVEETTTTTTTTVDQNTGEGSGNNVYLDGDNTTYNESGAN